MTVTEVLGEGGIELGGEAGVTFTPGTSGQLSGVVVEWDFDNDGDYDQAVEDVTAYLVDAETLTGRDAPSQLTGRAGPGELRMRLRNDDDRFSFFNAASPLNQDGNSLKVGRKIRLRVKVERTLDLPGSSGATLSTPDDPTIDVAGDLTIGAEVDPDAVTGSIQTIASKFEAAGDERSAMLQINASGFPRLIHSTDGTLANQIITTSGVALSARRRAVWVSIDVDDGLGGHVVRFYTARRIDETPELLDEVPGAGTTSIHVGTAPLVFGAHSGATERFSGDLYAGEWRAGLIDSTDVRANPNVKHLPVGTTSFTDEAGLDWAVNGAAEVVDAPAPVDPPLLVRDRFNRPDGLLGAAETGQAWTDAFPSFSVPGLVVRDQTATTDVVDLIPSSLIDAGVSDYYVQATVDLGPLNTNGYVALIVRFTDENNYAEVLMQGGVGGQRWIALWEIAGGVATELDRYDLTAWPGMTIGVSAGLGSSQEFVAYVCGVPVLTETLTIPSDATQVGMSTFSPGKIGPAPRFADFYVWDDVAGEQEGVIWSGDVSEVRPSAPVSGDKVAEVKAEGRLARAALPDVVAPRSTEGAPTGILVGDVLAKAGLLHPPAPLDEGTVTTGPVGIADGKGLELARKFEETELGFLFETPEGPIGFQDRQGRAGAPVAATFSDAEGGPLGYRDIAPLDQRRDIVNRVTAGVAHDRPRNITRTVDSNQTAFGVVNHVDVSIPLLPANSLCVVVIASTVATSGVGWHVPIWWAVKREFQGRDEDSIRTRVYTHGTGVEEAATTVRFYTNTGTLGGAWIAHVYVIEDWFAADNPQGVTEALFGNGITPPALVHGWGRVPCLFLNIAAGLTSLAGGSLDPDYQWPDNYYGFVDGQADFLFGSTPGGDVGLMTNWKIGVAESDEGTRSLGLGGFVILESGLLAVRGFNGPHVVLPTLKNPTQFEATPGRFVTVDDVASQDEIRTIRSHEVPSNLFATEDDAEGYGEGVLVSYSDDRPIFRITYIATKNASLRAQAIRRRVGDKIRLIAEHGTGMGVNADYFVESVRHRFADAGLLWEVTYDLSPA